MIIGTMFFSQVRYLNNTNLGFNKDLLVVIDVNTGKARTNFETVKKEMAKIPSVKNVSVTSGARRMEIIPDYQDKKEGNTGEPQTAYMFGADKDFLKTFEVTLLKGRNFDKPQ